MIVTCTTPDCLNNGIPIDVGEHPTDPETGEPIEGWRVICGPCGQVIGPDDATTEDAPEDAPDTGTEDADVT